jgi:uncharacterized pyridoxal phosphate-containing UPF0001 family protein
MDFKILAQAHTHKAKVLVVTKYLDATKTKEVLEKANDHPAFFGIGENRVEALKEKKTLRQYTHFIGALQSRQIPHIVKHCQSIHSLCSTKHAAKIEQICESINQMVEVFVQVNISEEPQKSGLLTQELPNFLKSLTSYKYLKVVGLSAIGAGVFTKDQKEAEFSKLKALRDKFLPGKIISAGTSRDYEIALEQGIEVVRVGKKFWAL